jgi:phosphate transport system permease protein
MVVLMVAGGSARIPDSIFQSVRPMTSAIAAEMGETVVGDLHYQSLFAIAIVLFMITFITNIVTEVVFLKRSAK